MKQAGGFGSKALLLVLCILLAQSAPPQASGQAQPQQQPGAKPLQYEVNVVLKLIHVYVTDKKGNPVTDLAVSDFKITDSGRPMTVTDFERRVLQAAAEPKPEAGPAPETKLVATPLPEVRPSVRKFFLFFDLAFNSVRGVTKAKAAALHFLDTQVGPEDQVGVITYSTFGGLKVHEFLTGDRGKVRDAVTALSQKDSLGRTEEIEQWYWRLVQSQASPDPKVVSTESSVAEDPKPPDYINEARAQRAEAKQLTRDFIEALTALAKSLRYVPDQKQFILFSSGIPSSLIYGAQAGNPDMTTLSGKGSAFDPGDSTLRDLNETMAREFAVAGCAFYSFDTRESAKGADLFGWDSRGLELGRSVLGKQTVFSDSTSLFKDDKLTGRDFLKRLSDTTGGQYFSNMDRYEKNLEQVQAVTGTYYVLGYPIDEQWDGKYHDVKVEVTRKGCEVRAQAGYFNPKPFSEYTDLEKRLHLFDLALNERALSRLPARIPMTSLAVGVEGISRLGVLARVPGEVTAKMTGRRVEFVAIFFDDKGEISDVLREETDPAALKGKDVAFAAGAPLKPGNYACRLIVRDMDTGQSAVASVNATVVKPQFTGLALGTPLVLEARAGCAFLSARAVKGREPFPWADLYPYDRAAFAPVPADLPSGTANIRVIVPCAVPSGGRVDLAVTANLVNAATGERSPLAISGLDSAAKGPLEILTLEVPTAGIAPGAYYLHIYAQDKAAGSLGHTSTTIRVRTP